MGVRAIGLLKGTVLIATDSKREGNGNREATYGPMEEKAGRSLIVSTVSISSEAQWSFKGPWVGSLQQEGG